jgi:hypothetical protein
MFVEGRDIRNQTFSWASKPILRKIIKKYTGLEKTKLLMLYHTLCLIESDQHYKKNSPKPAYTRLIFTYSGLSIEWIPKGLKDLEAEGIIKIQKEGEGPHSKKTFIFITDSDDIIKEEGEGQPPRLEFKKKKSKQIPSATIQDLEYYRDVWNVAGFKFQNIDRITPSRAVALGKLKTIVESDGSNFRNLWYECIKRSNLTPFLIGSGARGWVMTFNWLVKNDTNFFKILEKSYGPTLIEIGDDPEGIEDFLKSQEIAFSLLKQKWGRQTQ